MTQTTKQPPCAPVVYVSNRRHNRKNQITRPLNIDQPTNPNLVSERKSQLNCLILGMGILLFLAVKRHKTFNHKIPFNG